MPTTIGYVENFGVNLRPAPGDVLSSVTTTTTNTPTSAGFAESDVTSNFGTSTLAVELRDYYGYRVDATQYGQLIVRATLNQGTASQVG